MDFEALEEKVGFGLAVVLFNIKGRLDQLSPDKFSFDQWLKISNSATWESSLRSTALSKMSEKAETFEQCMTVCSKLPEKSRLRESAFVKV